MSSRCSSKAAASAAGSGTTPPMSNIPSMAWAPPHLLPPALHRSRTRAVSCGWAPSALLDSPGGLNQLGRALGEKIFGGAAAEIDGFGRCGGQFHEQPAAAVAAEHGAG